MSFTVACLKFAENFSSKPSRRYHPGLTDAAIGEVESTVRPILAELEGLRQQAVRAIDVRAAFMIPVGAIAGLPFGMFMVSDYPIIGALGYAVLGGMVGWVSAYTPLNNAYRRAYKTRIIPHLTARFGDLTYRPAEEPDLKRLAKLGLVPGFGKTKVEDEIFGTYRDVGINIVEANLETGGKNSKVVFNGLLMELAFPGQFSGVTVVAKDRGVLGNPFRDLVQAYGLERVRLEDPRFEGRYQVYGSDQIAARALLTPAVMERLMELDRQTQEDPPRLIAEEGTLRVALSRGKTVDLFEPPSIADPAHSGDMLLTLSSDIGSALRLVDAVLELAPMTSARTSVEP